MTITATDQSDNRSLGESHHEDRYFPVPVAIIASLPALRCNIYIQHPSSSRKVLYRGAHTDLPIASDEKLKSPLARHLYLRIDDRHIYEAAIQEGLSTGALDPSVQLALTVEQHRTSFEVALQNRNVAPVVAAAEKIAGDVLHVILADDFAVGKAVGLLDHDQCTFQHSCNVAIYCSALAARSGIPADDLQLLATAGILHDVGKRQIPNFILKKTGKLTSHEREMIRSHPTVGFRELATLQKLSWPQLMMAYQHHEWINGAGYPAGITGDDIHPWSKICAVADVFDALTINRPYRPAGHIDTALGVMQGETGHFDQDLFDLWVEVLGE